MFYYTYDELWSKTIKIICVGLVTAVELECMEE